MKKRNIKKRGIQKASFYIFAEKLIENLKELNKIKECPNCRNEIEKELTICEKCGQELGNKLTFEENMNYIRAYIQDIRYATDEATKKTIETYKKIIEGFLKDWELQKLWKEYFKLSGRLNPDSLSLKTNFLSFEILCKDFMLQEIVEKELLKRGVHLAPRVSKNWSNSHLGW